MSKDPQKPVKPTPRKAKVNFPVPGSMLMSETVLMIDQKSFDFVAAENKDLKDENDLLRKALQISWPVILDLAHFSYKKSENLKVKEVYAAVENKAGGAQMGLTIIVDEMRKRGLRV